MKFLKYLLYLVLGLFVLFLAVGFIMPEVKYGAEITVDKPAKEAWAVMLDKDKYGEWLEGFQSMELLSGEDGAVGSKYKVIVNPGEGQDDFEMIETVESFKEFENVTLNFDSDMMVFDQTTTMSEADGKTTIKTDSTVKGKGIMMRSMFAVMDMLTGSFQTQEQKNYDALKKLINENTTDYYPAPPPIIMTEVEAVEAEASAEASE